MVSTLANYFQTWQRYGKQRLNLKKLFFKAANWSACGISFKFHLSPNYFWCRSGFDSYIESGKENNGFENLLNFSYKNVYKLWINWFLLGAF